jgi:hypothetical protein
MILAKETVLVIFSALTKTPAIKSSRAAKARNISGKAGVKTGKVASGIILTSSYFATTEICCAAASAP